MNTQSNSDTLAQKSIGLSPRRESLRIKVLAEVAVMVALSGALYLVKVFTLPQGGSITLASMVPIFLVALRRGPKIGITAGIIFGLCVMLITLGLIVARRYANDLRAPKEEQA